VHVCLILQWPWQACTCMKRRLNF